MNTYIKPTSDIVIHYLLGSEKNTDLLLSFINAVLEDSDMPLVKSVEIKNPFNTKNFNFDKMSILDIKAIDENGRIYDIEVQSIGNKYFANRSLYYWARNYSDQLHESEAYYTLNPVICINLLDFIMIEDLDTVHTCFLPTEKNNTEYILSDHLEIHFIELPKFNRVNTKLKKNMTAWVEYFLNEGKENETMKIILKDSTFQKAHREYTRFTSSDEYREIIEGQQKWIRDQKTLIEGARRKGLKEGIEEGREEGKSLGEYNKAVNSAKIMISKGLSIELIAEVTGLAIDEIKELMKIKQDYQ